MHNLFVNALHGLYIVFYLALFFLQIPHLRPTEYKRSRLPRNRRTVNCPYGDVLAGGAVRERFAPTSLCIVFYFLHHYSVPFLMRTSCAFSLLRNIRVFLVEEHKIVKKVLKIQKAKEKQSSK